MVSSLWYVPPSALRWPPCPLLHSRRGPRRRRRCGCGAGTRLFSTLPAASMPACKLQCDLCSLPRRALQSVQEFLGGLFGGSWGEYVPASWTDSTSFDWGSLWDRFGERLAAGSAGFRLSVCPSLPGCEPCEIEHTGQVRCCPAAGRRQQTETQRVVDCHAEGLLKPRLLLHCCSLLQPTATIWRNIWMRMARCGGGWAGVQCSGGERLSAPTRRGGPPPPPPPGAPTPPPPPPPQHTPTHTRAHPCLLSARTCRPGRSRM